MGLPRRLAMFRKAAGTRTSGVEKEQRLGGWAKGKRGGGPGKKRDRRRRKQRTGHRFQAGRILQLLRIVYKNPLKVDLQFIYIKFDMTYFNDFAKWKFRGWRLSQMLEKTFFKPSGTKSTPIKYTSG
ncbi:hypothetical protein ALC60_02067 [Trachymyrmex zeteki]|uniref:Uncharacterized protein n=1 Tax=Mycetomoellerius zeteki TaxID=64791 RepID=A0A151XF10_9HYME|nr:hypothetical protein ALC60_02067 [Trachymyrmex zeteki]